MDQKTEKMMKKYAWVDGVPVLDLEEIEAEEMARKEKMSKKYKQLSKQICEIDSKIEHFESRIAATNGELSRQKALRSKLKEEKRLAIIAGDQAKADESDVSLFECEAAIRRAEETVVALREAVALAKTERQRLVDEQAEVFGSMASEWLRAEAGRWDEHALALIAIGRRLAAANSILRDMGLHDVFRSIILGKANRAFFNTRLPVIGDFNPKTMQPEIFQFGQDITGSVLSEISK